MLSRIFLGKTIIQGRRNGAGYETRGRHRRLRVEPMLAMRAATVEHAAAAIWAIGVSEMGSRPER